MTDYTIITARNTSNLLKKINEAALNVWPEFMLHDPLSDKYWGDLYSRFPDYQFAMVDNTGEIIAGGNSLPLAWNGNPADLPDSGWDWALEQGVKDAIAGRSPQTQCAIQIVIPHKYQGQGISAKMVQAMKAIGEAQGLNSLIAPVRPTLKSHYPLTPIDRYIEWEKDDLPFDPWLRVHARLGAKIIKACPHAMRITGTVEEWEKWAKMRFPESGTYVVPGALIPIEIDCEADLGTYIEPNVWMQHPIER